VRVDGQWKYLYRAVDKLGQTVDFLLTAKRDEAAARRFFEASADQVGSTKPAPIMCKAVMLGAKK
jgi:transposase-like protein